MTNFCSFRIRLNIAFSGYIVVVEVEEKPMVEHSTLHIRGKIIEISSLFNNKYGEWISHAKIPNSSVIAYCRDENRVRAEAVCVSRLLITLDDYVLDESDLVEIDQ